MKAENAMDCTILMEQYLDGKEVDVDVVMSQGEWRYAAATWPLSNCGFISGFVK